MTNPESKYIKKRDIKGKVYQIFGFDVMIDKNLKAWMLEINDHPSLDIYSCSSSMGCAHRFCPISEVDVHVKSAALTDALKLTIKSRTKSLKSHHFDRYNSLTKLYPFDPDSQLG